MSDGQRARAVRGLRYVDALVASGCAGCEVRPRDLETSDSSAFERLTRRAEPGERWVAVRFEGDERVRFVRWSSDVTLASAPLPRVA